MRQFTLFIALIFSLASSLSAQWESLGAATANAPRIHFSIDAVDAQTIWSVNIHPSLPVATNEVAKSVDGGQTWEIFTLPATTGSYYTVSVRAIDENTAWVSLVNLPAQDRAKVFKTTDGGQNWTEQAGEFNEQGRAFASMHFFNANDGLCFGSPGTNVASIDSIQVFKTSDGGDTWNRIPNTVLPELLPGEGNWVFSGNGAYESKGDTVWFVSRLSRVFRTTDKGTTWSAFDTGIHAGIGLSSIAFQDAQNGLVIGSDPNRAARTNDGGETWTEITIPNVPNAGSLEFIPGTEDTYLLSTGAFLTGNLVSISRDGGENWATISNTEQTKCIQFLSPTLGFAGGTVNTAKDKGLFKWTGNLSDPMYVNHAATGANTGASWEDAFVDLTAALAAADFTSQIWVAQGTYVPTNDLMDLSATYFRDTVGVHLYGGFAGGEANLEDRDPAVNVTVLSADLNGDDIPNNFEDNRTDNAFHVYVSIHENSTIIDGFTVTGAHALMGTGQNFDHFGGGIYAESDILVNNCTFVNNQAAQGAAFIGIVNSLAVTNSLFEGNNSRFGALFPANGLEGDTFLISGNHFERNTTLGLGGGLMVFDHKGIVENNVFENNTSDDRGGAACLLNAEVVFQNNTLVNNQAAGFGGGLYFDTNTGEPYLITGNRFEGNTSASLGGGLMSGFSDGTIIDNIFDGNSAASGGGAFLYKNDFDEAPIRAFSLSNNQFVNNTAENFGGGLTCNNFSDFSSYNIADCLFENNTAGSGGGGLSLVNQPGAMGTSIYTAEFGLENNTFINNTANFGGGMRLVNTADEVNATFFSSTFTNNTAQQSGGGIWMQTNNEALLNIEMDGLSVVGNTAMGAGGGLYFDVNQSIPLRNTIINENMATAGSGVFIEDGSELNAENLLIADNINSSAIRNNGVLNLLGVTCVDNSAGLDHGGLATTSFQNTIMDNVENYVGFNDNLMSLGGNLSSDTTLSEFFVGSGDFADLNETDPLLDVDFVPTASSPCVDAGNPTAVAQDDLAGNDRIQGATIDIGAYESTFTVSSTTNPANSFNMEVFPNPFVNELRVTSKEPILSLELFDVQGRSITKKLNTNTLTELKLLTAGVYLLKAETAKGSGSLRVLKH